MELWFRIRDFFRYTRREKRDLILAVLVVTLAFAYNDGRETFIPAKWAVNFLVVLFFVYLSLMFRTAAQKIVALQNGFTTEFRCWPVGLVITAIITLLSNGNLLVILPGGIILYHMTLLRMGKFRYGENITSRGMIAASGAFANLVLATIALTFSAQLGIFPELFNELAYINFVLIIFTLLPLPRMDGIHLFFMSRLTYVFVFSTLVAYILLTFAGVYSWILAFFIGVICWLLYYINFEQD